MSVENIVQEIDKEIANLTEARVVLARLNGSAVGTAVDGTAKRVFSAASRRKMAAAQKARWAKHRGNQTSPKPAKPTRIVSASARRKMASAQKARWAKVRASKRAA
jgi:hypothetical protein